MYRHDVQILRGIAVTLVVLYHLNIGGFGSGFLGVDVFFVISGYLMGEMYDHNNIKIFFEKRMKRLLPAFFATIFFTIIGASLLTQPSDFSQVVIQSYFASFFISNIGFWFENSYFESASFRPLLHLWSLGVEVQFYIILPLLAFFFRKSKFNFYCIILISLFSCFFVTSYLPKTSFFMLPFRLWEFLIGYGVSVYFLKNGLGKFDFSNHLGLLGFCIILLIPFIQIDGQDVSWISGHPGLGALVITLATALVLMYGLPNRLEKSIVGIFFDRLGGYSYSIYLAHFPVIVLALYEPFSGTIIKPADIKTGLVLLVLVFLFSAMLFFFFEKQFRNINVGSLLKYVMPLVFLVPISASLFVYMQKIWIPPADILLSNSWYDRGPIRCGKWIRLFHPTAVTCKLSEGYSSASANVLLVGNSHADSIKFEFEQSARQAQLNTYFVVENTPLMKGGVVPGVIANEAVRLKAKAVVLHYSPSGINISNINLLYELLKESGIPIYFILPVPVWDSHIPKSIFMNSHYGQPLPVQTRSDYFSANKKFIEQLSSIGGNKFHLFDVSEVLCTPKCVYVSSDGVPYYYDNGHLTLTGAKLLRPVFDRINSSIRGLQ